MKKIVYISDFLMHEIQKITLSCGAEIYDDVLLRELEEQGHKVVKFNSSEFGANHLKVYENSDFMFLVSNFWHLHPAVRNFFSVYPDRFCIIEHDHKYLKTRDPSVFIDFSAPPSAIINKDFYKSAKAVFTQSTKHTSVVSSNLKLDNIHNLSCSLWSKWQLGVIQKNLNSEKINKALIINNPNPVKGTDQAIKFCEKKGIEYDVIEIKPYEEFIETLSKYEKFVFFPQVLESFGRVIIEARMLGCKVITNANNGCSYEPWFKGLKGQELIDYVDSQRSTIVKKISDKLFEVPKHETKEGDITVILNCYRRPHNLKMQVDAIRAQSIKPKPP